MRHVLLVMLAGCATSTGGELVDLPTSVSSTAPSSFTVGDWQVRLTRAELAVGPIYLWSDLPERADESASGLLVAEVPDRVRMDLLDETPVALQYGRGRAAEVRSAEIWLEPGTDGDTVELVGEAERDGESLPFEAAITWDHPWIAPEDAHAVLLRRRLRTLPLDGTVDESSALEIAIDPAAWLSEAGLDALVDIVPDEDGVRRLTPESLTGRDLDQGIRRSTPGESWTLELVSE